jgi:hypothetical protein
MAVDISCAACGAALSVVLPVGRRETCSRCAAELHSCRQCDFYDERAPKECRDPVAEPPRDKEGANFCDLFRPRKSPLQKGPSKEELRAAAEALFKKKSS